ncbi:PREDICTED: uncharacterized protein LOC108358254 isoform X2 [Rhagoletis zephyria]|uniref:uncharacterized protein LOC118734836 n=1 Tax=Rhagoletis pomonella TaxID=28610 RepID=UPI0008112D12|nr:PREDICTED: uncharacterized protein LOC108358254 isoform X2 [Rhagoletis zephyria]XP_036320406.1 uncharacterized protein LOC118734836 [Rhagoletis pomonella]
MQIGYYSSECAKLPDVCASSRRWCFRNDECAKNVDFLAAQLSPIKYTTITEGIVSIPLLGSAIFQNQFGLKTQHPIIPLLQNQSVNINDVAHKIVGIFNHHDQQRKEHRRCPIQRLFGLACYH